MDALAMLSPFTLDVLLMILVIVVKMILTAVSPHQPMRLFNLYCKRLADKVNKPSNSANQQQLAGVLALVISVTPILIITWLFEDFVLVPELWQAFILYICLGGIGIFTASKNIAKQLTANQKYEAKESLKPFVLRETSNLSSLGLTKATIEIQVLTLSQQLIGVCFYFLLLGPVGVLMYRLSLEAHYAWNTKQPTFVAFGKGVASWSNLLQYLPNRLFALCLLLTTVGHNALLNWRLSIGYFFQANNSVLLNLLALALGCKLGGVAMYQGEKIRKTAFNDHGKQPEVTDIIHASARLKQALILCAIVLVITVIFANLTISK